MTSSALKWVLVNVGISAVMLLVVNMLERKNLLTTASRERRSAGMSLLVDIEKRLETFHSAASAFEAGHGTLALLGASGCGKSMTLKCIAGIMTPDRGPHRSRRRDAL